MKFRMNETSTLTFVEKRNVVQEMKDYFPTYSCIVDMREVKTYMKEMKFLNNKTFSIAPIALAIVAPTAGVGVFWSAFLQYIFPWVLDVGKVYCCIRIAQAFWQERRGGKDDASGMSAMLTHGKWYLCLWLLPLFVELVDGIGATMFENMRNNPVQIQR